MPAKSVRVKPGWENVAEPLEAGGENRKEKRRIDYDLPENLEVFDEFQRSLSPPE